MRKQVCGILCLSRTAGTIGLSLTKRAKHRAVEGPKEGDQPQNAKELFLGVLYSRISLLVPTQSQDVCFV